ncbi:hypothetical protein [Tenacibaculum aquimarinum]|uniref:hypothetical protein n=1 Tax=Tenacibaculum aquimarinum TaxID=2910675 RepID=UPI001F0A1FE7|nr:hypothetical protein [Tenacibaculum aquimarinum]MCH3882633.1 hypothetical protein [Tenacibaculum aquimarinum]
MKPITLLLFLSFFFSVKKTTAQITEIQETPITLLETYTGNYNYTVTGGSLRDTPNSANACSVVNSDSQLLTGIPTGATITRAYLYWSGSGEVIDTDVTFQSQPITAERTYVTEYDFNNGTTTYNIHHFNAIADVTSIVQTNLNTTYLFEDLSVDTAFKYCTTESVLSGWALVVVYNEASLPLKKVNVYEGFEVNRNNTSNFNITALNIPVSPTGNAAGIFWEGDETLQGTNGNPEQLRFNNNVLTDAINPTAGAFNSTVNVVPSSTEYGVDIDSYDVTPYISAGQTSATVSVRSANDLILANVILIAVDTYAPDLAITKTSSANGNPVVPGQVITYTIEVKNNGAFEQATDLVVEDILPPGVSYNAGTAQKTYLIDDVTTGTFSHSFTGLPATFDIAGFTQSYTVTSSDVPSGSTLTSYQMNVQGASTDFRSDISLVATYPNGTAYNLGQGSFGGGNAGNFNVSRGPGVFGGAAEGNYTFVWNDGFDGVGGVDDNTITAASFTINYELVNRVPTTDAAGDPSNLIAASENFNLQPTESVTITFDVTVDDPINSSITQIKNDVSANAINSPDVVFASVTDLVASIADLSLTKTVDNALPKIGSNIVYTLTVTNDGFANATGVQVTDVLPTGLTFVSDNSATTSTTYIGNIWNIGNLNVNQTIVLQITATVNGAGEIINNAEITQSNQTDLDSTPASGD